MHPIAAAARCTHGCKPSFLSFFGQGIYSFHRTDRDRSVATVVQVQEKAAIEFDRERQLIKPARDRAGSVRRVHFSAVPITQNQELVTTITSQNSQVAVIVITLLLYLAVIQ